MLSDFTVAALRMLYMNSEDSNENQFLSVKSECLDCRGLVGGSLNCFA